MYCIFLLHFKDHNLSFILFLMACFLFKCIRQNLDLNILKTIDFFLPDIIFCKYLTKLELTEQDYQTMVFISSISYW